MKCFGIIIGAAVSLGGMLVYLAQASEPSDGQVSPIYGIRLPAGYRDWKLISVAHEEGNLNDLRAVLGNDVAVKLFGMDRFRFRTARSSPALPGATSRRRRTTRPLAERNPSSPDRPPMCSSWSRTQKSSRPPVAGDSLSSRTANPRTRCCTNPVFHATGRSRPGTWSLPITHPDFQGALYDP